MTYEFTQDWFTDNLEHFRFCAKVVSSHDAALEVGCFEGRATLWLLDNFAHVHAVDTFRGGDEHAGLDMEAIRRRFLHNTAGHADRLTLHERDSGLALAGMLAAGLLFDFVYIDGSHAARDVALDAMLGFRLLRPGGVMLLDDYLWNRGATEYDNPRPGIDFFLESHWDDLDVLYRGWQVSVRKHED